MRWMSVIQDRADETLMSVTRSTQAALIESFDRTIGHDTRLPGTRRFKALRSHADRWLLEEPAARLDHNYELFQRMLALHREFAQRMFEVLDSRDTMPGTEPAGATCQVLPFTSPRAQHR